VTARKPPPPSNAHGRTRCPGCSKRFTDTPDMPTTEIEGSVENRGHVSSAGFYHHGIGRHAVTITWHTEHLDDFRRSNAALREQARQDSREMIRTLAEAGGLDVDATLAEFDRRNPPEETP